MSDGYKESVLDELAELQELVASGSMIHGEPHSVSDFERKRFRSYECAKCGCHIGKQQLVALHHIEQMKEVVDTDARPQLTEYNAEIDIIHPTD